MKITEEKIVRFLNKLENGIPIDEDIAKYFWKKTGEKVRKSLIQDLIECQNSEASNKIKNFWIVGEPGTGKTQTLKQIISAIKEKEDSLLIASFDLRLDDITISHKFEETLLLKLKFLTQQTDSSGLNNKLFDKKFEKPIEDTIGFGVDILTLLIGFTIPGTGLILGKLSSWANENFILNKWMLRRSLKKKGITGEYTISLIQEYLRLAVNPSLVQYKKLREIAGEIAVNEQALDILKEFLRGLNKRRIMITIDECQRMTASVANSLYNLRTLLSEDEAFDLFFIFSGVIDFDIYDQSDYVGFKRRFIDRSDTSVIIENIKQPNVRKKKKADDDLKKATIFLQDLRNSYSMSLNLSKSIDKLESKREVIYKELAKREITWSRFWTELIKHLNK